MSAEDPQRSRDWRRALAELRQCASAGGRAALGGYSIEGLRLVERALRADATLEFVVVSDALVASRRDRERELLQALAAAPDLQLIVAPEAEMAAFLKGRTYGALLGFVRTGASQTLEALFQGRPGGVLLAAVDAEDPGNVGALVRTAYAGGASAFVAVGVSDPYHPKAVRTSMGSVFRLPILRFEDASTFLEALRAARVLSVGAVSCAGVPLPQLKLETGRAAILLGSEAFGLPEDVCTALDERVTIPMRDDVDSYSINAAAAILLYALIQAGG